MGYDLHHHPLFNLGSISWNFIIPLHSNLLDFVSYVPCNDIISANQCKELFSPHMYAVN
jgi:hypothetical protein